MTKLLHFGLPLEEVVRRATAAPARILGCEAAVGTLRPGANADVALFELRDENFEMRDSDGNTVVARRRLLPRATVKGGRIWHESP
jgi:dihydroorotase